MIFKEELEKFQASHVYKNVDINGIRTTYLLCGNPKSRMTLIYLVGGLGLSTAWLSHIKEMEKDYQILTFEYPMQIEEINTLARYTIQLMEQLHIENPVLIGASFGGFLCQIIAGLIPDKVQGVCLYSTCSLSQTAIKELKKQYWIYKPMLGLMQVLPYSWMKKMFAASSKKILSCEDEDEESRKFTADLFDWAYGQYTKEFDLHLTKLIISPGSMKPMIKEEYEQFDFKTLLVLPADDKAFSDSAKKDLVNIMPKAEVVKIKGGHVATLAKTEEYIKVTRAFIERQDAAYKNQEGS